MYIFVWEMYVLSILISIFTNPFAVTALSSWGIAQILKVFIHAIIVKRFELSRLFGDGGMPSGHSATVSSLATITGLMLGFGTFEFAMSTILAIVVCHDAMGVRRETGRQAAILNEIMEYFENLVSNDDLPGEKLKEFVGHTPFQVIAGILLGIANATMMYYFVFK